MTNEVLNLVKIILGAQVIMFVLTCFMLKDLKNKLYELRQKLEN